LPWEISRLPLVESSFDYNAYSSAGAAGIWQFIRSTGRRYLRISAAIDERRDPIVASQAAAQYLLNSYEKLGSWPLAITSYNHGLAGIMRAVKSTGSKDLSVIIDRYESRTFGFASQNFYCEFVAALEVEQNWQKYFPDLVIEQPWYVDEVRLPGAIHYRDLLRATGLSEDVFKKYNRALNKPVLSNRARIASDYVVKVPKGHGAALMANLGGGTQLTAENSWSYYQAKRVGKVEPSYAYYKVGSGDTVGRLAQKFGVSQSELMAMNGIRNPRHLRLGMKLKVPETQSVVVSSAKPAPQTIVAKAEKPTSYRVQKGETVSELAARFDISNSTLMAANGLTNARSLQAGQLLKVPSKDVLTDEEVMSEMSPAPPESYIVQSGETLSEISERFGVSVSKLKAANKLKNPRYLRAGAKLSIPSSGTGVAESKQKTHTVEAGDNLITIAERYGVTVDQLVEANNIKNPELLVVGKVIRVTPPLKSKPPESSENNYHVVQKGESLASISKSTGITVAELIKLNPDAGDLIYPSQRLRLNR
jgi:membrane-bound lytic murein transglycosylase D